MRCWWYVCVRNSGVMSKRYLMVPTCLPNLGDLAPLTCGKMLPCRTGRLSRLLNSAFHSRKCAQESGVTYRQLLVAERGASGASSTGSTDCTEREKCTKSERHPWYESVCCSGGSFEKPSRERSITSQCGLRPNMRHLRKKGLPEQRGSRVHVSSVHVCSEMSPMPSRTPLDSRQHTLVSGAGAAACTLASTPAALSRREGETSVSPSAAGSTRCDRSGIASTCSPLITWSVSRSGLANPRRSSTSRCQLITQPAPLSSSSYGSRLPLRCSRTSQANRMCSRLCSTNGSLSHGPGLGDGSCGGLLIESNTRTRSWMHGCIDWPQAKCVTFRVFTCTVSGP